MNYLLGSSSCPLPFRFVHSSTLCDTDHHELSTFFESCLSIRVRCCRVLHGGTGATAVRIDHLPSGASLVCSGDSRPCQSLATLAQGVSLFICEATFADEDWVRALGKAHMTTSEALHIAAVSESYRVLLTHFSQRRSTIPLEDLELTPDKRIEEFRRVRKDARMAAEREGKVLTGKMDYMGPELDLDASLLSPLPAQIIVAMDLLTIDFARLKDLPRELYQVLCRLKATANLHR